MTAIPFAEKAWPVATGCTKIEQGCQQCYAARLAGTRLKRHKHYKGLAEYRDGVGHWIAPPKFNVDILQQPLHWRKPRTVFVAHTGDLFHKNIGWGQIRLVWGIMKDCPQHTFLVFTKRWVRAQETLSHELFPLLPNAQLIFSASTQAEVDECAPILFDTPAAVRGLSLEPLLERIVVPYLIGLDRIITGGENALRKSLARPCPVGAVRSLQKQCADESVPFWFKGWGANLPDDQVAGLLDGVRYEETI